MSRTKKEKKRIPRNGSLVAARNKKAGPMKHRLEPKKGANNDVKKILEEEYGLKKRCSCDPFTIGCPIHDQSINDQIDDDCEF